MCTDQHHDAIIRRTQPKCKNSASRRREVSYTYDNAGNRASITAPDGTLTQYAYNANNQMTTATTGTDATSYSYYGTTQLHGARAMRARASR
ncbi:MAG: hypothetical protein LBS51_02535 [Oscillospiraceae bacterium]|nr:hypothetical protein [Oscillospiraceae bacterium]